jgi:hypothetical protein
MKPIIRSAWTAATSADENWTPDNPALGQCAVTALIIQDLLGGQLLRGMFGDVSHYWNLLPDGTQVDATRDQFPEGSEIVTDGVRPRAYVLSFEPTRLRYEALRAAVLDEMAGRDKEVSS